MVDWSQIVEQHGPLVWTTVYRLLRHDADAADCFQRTFLSALLLSRTQTIRNLRAAAPARYGRRKVKRFTTSSARAVTRDRAIAR